MKPVALRSRSRMAALLDRLLQEARQCQGWSEPDRRNVRTFKQLTLGVLVARSTRLLELGRTMAHARKAGTIKSLAVGLGYFLSHSRFDASVAGPALLEAGLRRLDADRLALYKGRALLVIDPTEYPKRSRGSGKRGRGMQYAGRVRKKRGSGTTWGYTDVWAGVVLKGKRLLPLARRLYSGAHPTDYMKNRLEETVLNESLEVLERLGMEAIVVADSEFGRKQLLIRLAGQAQPYVIRLTPDINALVEGREEKLEELLCAQPYRGEAMWECGQEGELRCRVRVLEATIRYSQSGRKDDHEEATLTFVQLVPMQGKLDPLVLATTLPVHKLAEARAVAKIYSLRWAVECGFETMKSWGLERFMVRSWVAIDRLLWVVAIAYTLTVLTLYDAALRALRRQAKALLRCDGVLGRKLTPGKLADAISLDHSRHRRAWTSAWLS